MEHIGLQIIISVIGLTISWSVATALFGKKNDIKYMPPPPMPPYEPKTVKSAIKEECEHDWNVESTHKSQREIRPLNAFHDSFYVDSTVIARRCKKCGWHEVVER